MQFFYDGQIRRYITQVVRVFSNFVVRYGDGSLHRIPVMYGDADRQVASIIRNNSENKVNSVPRISVYVTALALDRDRLSDSTYIGKVNVRERGIDDSGAYNQTSGRNYTVERIMPTPFKLTMKVDIWSSSTEQKLQILEQVLVLFNPSLELQTTDNFVDWTSLTVLNLNDISWSSRTVPVGTDTPIEIGTLTLETPIWISPPAKVKHLGVITKIITSMYSGSSVANTGYIEGLGNDLADPDVTLSNILTRDVITITDYQIQVYAGKAYLMTPTENVIPREPTLDIAIRNGPAINWDSIFNLYPGQYTAGSSRIFLTQPNGTDVIGTIAVDPLDHSILHVNWNVDTLVTNTGIDSTGLLDTDQQYNGAGSYRARSPGTIDAIVNPQTYNPKRPTGTEETDQAIAAGTRFLIIEDIGSAINNTDSTYASAWGPLIANTNDIIEYTGSVWNVIFHSTQESNTMIWQTNIYTGVQYLWNGVSWVKSFEGDYGPGSWRIEL